MSISVWNDTWTDLNTILMIYVCKNFIFYEIIKITEQQIL